MFVACIVVAWFMRDSHAAPRNLVPRAAEYLPTVDERPVSGLDQRNVLPDVKQEFHVESPQVTVSALPTTFFGRIKAKIESAYKSFINRKSDNIFFCIFPESPDGWK